MSKATRMNEEQARKFLARAREAERAQAPHLHCEYGHLDDSDRPNGACLDEVLGLFPHLADEDV